MPITPLDPLPSPNDPGFEDAIEARLNAEVVFSQELNALEANVNQKEALATAAGAIAQAALNAGLANAPAHAAAAAASAAAAAASAAVINLTAPGPIGGTTPNAVAATTLSVSEVAQFGANVAHNNGTGSYWYNPGTTTWFSWRHVSTGLFALTSSGGGQILGVSDAGLAVTGALSASGHYEIPNGGSYSVSVPSIFQIGGVVQFSGGSGGFAWNNTANSVSHMALDANGNLGLGVTPSAWGSNRTGLDLGTLPHIVAQGTNMEIGTNYYHNGTNYVYKVSNAATLYTQYVDTHAWYTAPTGTAGGLVTFAEAMRLTNTGLTVTGTLVSAGSGKQVAITASSAGAQSIGFTGGYGGKMGITFGNSGSGGNNSMAIVQTQGASPTLDIMAVEGMAPNGDLTTGYTPLLRVDYAGNLLVGVASANYHKVVKDSANNYAFEVRNDSASSPYGQIIRYNNVSGGAGANFLTCTDDTARFVVQGNGNVVNINNSYGAISDIKLKENITDATPKLAKLLKVRIVNYNIKTDPTHKQIGVIAQELEEISPGLIEETPDCIDVEVEPARTEVRVTQRQKTELRESVRYETTLVDGQWRKLPIATMEAVPLFEDHPLFDEAGDALMELVEPEQAEVLGEDGEVVTPFRFALWRQSTHRVPVMEDVEETVEVPAKIERLATGEVTKSVKYSVFVPMLIKAMQEQQELIEALAERVTALEVA
ncbi:MAG: tail fiber domain-containing protein [Rhodoferax sp.]|nr:tail fiber domain-containing protein [Rhodoferax sp.]MDP3650909.1 tail fiber domain-containing protein [Rhodoferax sp.]